MADSKISALPASTTPLAGTEVLPVVQSSTTKQVSVTNLTAGRSVSATNFIPSGSAVPTNGVYLPAANSVGVATNSAVRTTVDANGNFLVNTASAYGSGATPHFFITAATAGTYVAIVQNTNATPGCLALDLSADPNNSSDTFIATIQNRFAVRSNGGIVNYAANNVILSDRRQKTNFAPAKSYLDVICAIAVQTFNYIDQNLETDAGLTLGVTAQDVQAVAPEFVSESNWGTKEEPKMRLEIYQTDLQYALMKCIQEQQALIESLTVRLTALENR